MKRRSLTLRHGMAYLLVVLLSLGLLSGSAFASASPTPEGPSGTTEGKKEPDVQETDKDKQQKEEQDKTDKGEAQTTPTPTVTPEATVSPTPADTAAPTSTPEATTKPEASATPEATVSPTPPVKEESVITTPEFESKSEVPEGYIGITTLEDLKKIGTDEGYPLDGKYILMGNIEGEIEGEFLPIGTAEEPFRGEFDGNGFAVCNLKVSNEGETGFFCALEGKVENLALINITIETKGTEGSTEVVPAGILAGIIRKAQVSNVIVSGTIPETEGAGIFAGVNEEGTYEGCIYSTVDGVAFGDGFTSDQVVALATTPSYLAVVGVTTEEISAAQETTLGFVFDRWEADEKYLTIVDASSAATSITTTGETGTTNLKAIYAKQIDEGKKLEIAFATPVVIGKDINSEEVLEPVDPTFPTQLEEIKPLEPVDTTFPTQLEELKPLEPIDNTFPTQIEVNPEDEVPEDVIEITTWEQFKNIGNTEYDPEFTMTANYVLAADLVSDGEPFAPIGTEENPFYGTFDGRTFVFDLTLNPEIDTEAPYKGLFGVVLAPPEEKAADDETKVPESTESPMPSAEPEETEAPKETAEPDKTPTPEEPVAPEEDAVSDKDDTAKQDEGTTDGQKDAVPTVTPAGSEKK